LEHRTRRRLVFENQALGAPAFEQQKAPPPRLLQGPAATAR